VRDDIVELAGDAVPFVTNRFSLDQLLVTLEQPLLFGQPAREASEHVRRDDESGHEDHVGPVVVALVDEGVVGENGTGHHRDSRQSAKVTHPASEREDRERPDRYRRADIVELGSDPGNSEQQDGGKGG